MTIQRARTLRKTMPPAEARLWNLLRTEPFAAFHFRRQVPIGRYYADFATHAAKLVIEVDGETHGADAAIAYDSERETFIKGEGYAVLRFANADVMQNLEGVGTRLLQVLHQPPNGPGLATHMGGRKKS